MQLSPRERSEGRLDPASVELARAVFDLTGFVLVESVVPLDVVEACRAEVQADLGTEGRAFLTFPEVDGIGTSFFDFTGPFADHAIVANPILLQLLDAVIGPAYTCAVYNTNVSMPGTSVDQPVHTDVESTQDDGSPFPRHASVHITLCDFTEENGSTELWPGTHRHPSAKDDDLERLAREVPSVRANLPAGSLIVRDATTWHRGRINRTTTPREMLSMFIVTAGTAPEGNVYGRPLEIADRVLEAMPERARAMWAINATANA